jgi:hypothetical protein
LLKKLDAGVLLPTTGDSDNVAERSAGSSMPRSRDGGAAGSAGSSFSIAAAVGAGGSFTDQREFWAQKKVDV